MDVPRGTIAVWSDIGCPWGFLAVHRLHDARSRLQLDEDVTFEHLAFPLELFNERPTPKRSLDAEIVVLGSHAPDADYHVWTRRDSEWPVTTLPALEAVRAAHLQDARAAEALDWALRRVFFCASKCISLRHVILEAADSCPEVDRAQLEVDLDAGVARHRVIEEWRRANAAGVAGSPHLFFPDGSDAHNPGIATHWEKNGGYPVIDQDDPTIYDDLLQRAVDGAG